MHELFLLLVLMMTPLEAEVHFLSPEDVAARLGLDPCEAARIVAEQGACTRAEDCDAFEGWMRIFGEPRTEPLDPRIIELPERPSTFNCPAPGPRRAPGGEEWSRRPVPSGG